MWLAFLENTRLFFFFFFEVWNTWRICRDSNRACSVSLQPKQTRARTHARTHAHAHTAFLRAHYRKNTGSAEVSHLRTGVERRASCVKFQASVSQTAPPLYLNELPPRLNIQQWTCEKCWHRDVEHQQQQQQQQQQRSTVMKYCLGLFSTFFFLFFSCSVVKLMAESCTMCRASNELRTSIYFSRFWLFWL